MTEPCCMSNAHGQTCDCRKRMTDEGKALADMMRERDAAIARAEKAEAEVARLREALAFARPLVERWCHYQGDHPSLFREYLGPIDAALNTEGE